MMSLVLNNWAQKVTRVVNNGMKSSISNSCHILWTVHLFNDNDEMTTQWRHSAKELCMFKANADSECQDQAPRLWNFFPCSTWLSMNFVLLINLKLLTTANSLLLNIAEHDIFSANRYENANLNWHFHFSWHFHIY